MRPSEILKGALARIAGEMNLETPQKLTIERPRNQNFGDLSTNMALLLARDAGQKPLDLARKIASRLVEIEPEIEKAEAAGPGFCNVTFRPQFWQKIIAETEKSGNKFGHSRAGGGKKVLLEYVSANPTGPLHVGHGRGAAIGDSAARILRAVGYDVSSEYYLNDAGRQMNVLGESVWRAAQALSGKNVAFPEDGYKGEYIRVLAAEALELEPGLPDLPDGEGIDRCREFGMGKILEGIKKDLADFGCEHQTFFSEKSLIRNGSVEKTLSSLEASGKAYREDGALWFETASMGDDRNRVLRKSDGSLTYFASDIAYHDDKFRRGFEWLIDVWGADHHGYVPRMKAAIRNMGEDPDKFSVLLVQLVNLLRGGEVVSMSTRSGEFVALADVLREVGVDAARFMFLSRSSDSPLDFDLELAKQRTMDNPVYYVQYAHARICALQRRAAERGISLGEKTTGELSSLLDRPEEIAIMRQMSEFEELIENAAKNLAPHYIGKYLVDLATSIHSYYAKCQIIDDSDQRMSRARLGLLRGAAQTVRNGLFLLGASAPETM